MRRFLFRSLYVAGIFCLTVGMTATGLGQTGSSNQDFKYVANPPRVEVSPDTVVPAAVPLCKTANTSVPTHPIIYCYSPNFIRTAYNFPAGFDGTGQTIVIVDAYGSPTIANDLHVFDLTFGLPDPDFTVICPLGCPTFSPNNFFLDEIGWTIETTLDVEWAHAMAPGAKIVLAVAPTPAGNAINAVESFVIQGFPGSIVSQSFGVPEAVIRANNSQLMQAHANYQAAVSQGITVLASAGDSGASNGFSFANALFPASDPFVTAIGGTEGLPYPNGLVTFTGSCSPGPRPGFPTGCTPTGYGGEQVWNESWLPAATGGAPSLIFPTPSYQAGLGFSKRTTPDVSYNAAVDGGVLVYYTALGFPIWFIVGGTSAGSPQWAGIFAIANQERAENEKLPLGFVNPAIYSITESSSYLSDFHDITVGDNTQLGTGVGFPAGMGYDLASGWGTPNVANLVSDLAALP